MIAVRVGADTWVESALGAQAHRDWPARGARDSRALRGARAKIAHALKMSIPTSAGDPAGHSKADR